MKHIKLVICILLILGLALTFTACFGGVIDVDKDGNVKIKGEDGEIEIGSAKWDSSKVFGLDAPKAELEGYISTEGGVIYTYSGMDEDDVTDYINKIKAAGFTYNMIIMDDYMYTGTNSEGQTISFSYDAQSKEGTISATQGDKPEEGDEGKETVYGGSNVEWHSDRMGGLPDPGVEIESYWSADGDTSYTLKKMDDYLEYVDEIKACGFTIDPETTEYNETYYYIASNDNGDKISFTVSADSVYMSFIAAK